MGQNTIVQLPKQPDTVKGTTVKRDLTTEFVVSNSYSVTQQRTLQPTIDDVELEVNLKTYDRMENDSTVSKVKKILITSVLADELQFSPGTTEEEVSQEEYEVYEWVLQFCERVISGLDKPFKGTLEQILGNAIRHGHGIAEIQWEYRKDAPPDKPEEESSEVTNGPKRGLTGRLGAWLGFKAATDGEPGPLESRPNLQGEQLRIMPKSLKVKPRGAVRFVVDDYMNVLGLLPKRDSYRELKWGEILSREKFLVLTMNQQDEDPRGKSCYRPAFNWYNLKTQVPAELLRFILEETVPKAVGTLPEQMPEFEYERDENGDIVYDDPDTKKIPRMLTAAESFKRQIEGFRGGSGAVIPFGAKLEPYKKGLTGSNDANLFSRVLKIVNDEIENAVLLQTLAQSEGEHQARSASEQVAQVLHNLVFWTRWLIAMMVLSDLCATAVRLNLGDWALKYLPVVSLGDFVRRDWNKDLEAVSDAYFKGFLDDSQRPELMSWLNLPKAGPSRQSVAMANQDVNGEPIRDNDSRPDKQPGSNNRNAGNGTEKKNGKQNTNTRLSTLDLLGNHRGWTTRFKRNL